MRPDQRPPQDFSHETNDGSARSLSGGTSGLNAAFKGVLVLCVLAAIGLAVWFGGLLNSVANVSNTEQSIAFDQARWINEPDGGIRVLMVEDLIASRLREGMHDSVVYELLGGPDYLLGQGPGRLVDFDLVYYLGTALAGREVGDQWLVIELNDRGETERFDTLLTPRAPG